MGEALDSMKNTTVIITGASRGIGAATARHFAGLGADLVLLATSADRLEALADELASEHYEVHVIAGSVADYAVLEKAADTALGIRGRIDVLVNNAGVIEPIARMAESSPENWSQAIDVNVKGVYYGLRAVLPHMISAGTGTVVNLSSGAATGALEGWSSYCASKAAVLSLTRCAHKEAVDSGVRVVGISPGTVETDMQTEIRESGVNPVSQLPQSAHIPAEWVAKSIAFLCGPGGDDYLGTDFSIKTDEGRAAVGLPPVGG